MLDARFRSLIDPPLNAVGRALAALGVGADHVTFLGLVFGLSAALTVAAGWFWTALALIALNRIADGLDGAVARAAGITIEPTFRDDALATMSSGRSHLPSMAHDVRTGRQTEVMQLNEQISRRGLELGIPTPTQDAVLDLVRVFDWRALR